MKTGKPTRKRIPAVAFGCLRWSADGRTVAGLGDRGVFREFDAATGREAAKRDVPDAGGRAGIDFTPDGKWAASWDRETNEGSVVAAASGKVGWTWKTDGEAFDGARFSPDGGRWAGPDAEEGAFGLRDVASGRWTALDRPAKRVKLVAWSSDGRSVATAVGASDPKDDLAEVWEAATGKRRKAWQMPAATALAFAPDGATLAAGDAAGTVRLYDVAAGRSAGERSAGPGRVRAVGFAPDGKWLAAAGVGPVRVWDADGKAVHEYEGHAGAVLALAFAPDSTRLATAGADGVAFVWDLAAPPKSGPAEPLRDAVGRLTSAEADEAYRGMAALRKRPGEAVAVLREALKPVRRRPPATWTECSKRWGTSGSPCARGRPASWPATAGRWRLPSGKR